MADGLNPYAPPQAEVKDAPQVGQELAGRGSRLLAIIIDMIVQVGLLFVVGWMLGLKIFDADPSMGRIFVNGLIGWVLFLLVQGWLLVTRGQTVGKLALSLRIVRKDGTKASAGRLLGLRYGVGFLVGIVPFVGMIYGLIDSLLIFRQSRQCLHDQIADTIVVRA